MKVVKKKLADLKSPEKNIRLHPEKQITEYIRSIEKNGQIRPIVIDEENVIWIGNGLREAMTRCGYTEAHCLVKTGMSKAEKMKMMMADNRVFDLGVDDMATFDEFILELKDDLDIPGFDEDMLKSFVMDTKEADELISGYGVIAEGRAEEMRDTRAQYERRDAEAAAGAIRYEPGNVPDEVREAAGYAAGYVSEDGRRGYILCPKCGERIWL